MPDIEIVGSGFVPGIPGIWANTSIPLPEKDGEEETLPSSSPPEPLVEPAQPETPPSEPQAEQTDNQPSSVRNRKQTASGGE